MTVSKSIVFDSSCWIEFLTSGPLVKTCEKELNGATKVIVPTLTLFEVYKKVFLKASEDQALSVVAFMSQYEVVELTKEISLAAADLSITHKLAMADSIVLASACHCNATLVTLDNDFVDIPNTRVLR